MNSNIKHQFNHKQDLIDMHLRYLYEQKSSVMLRIQAIEFLYPYINEDNILEKFKYFYQRERDLYIKTLLKKAIDGKLESYIVTDFDGARASEREATDMPSKNFKRMSAEELAILRMSSF